MTASTGTRRDQDARRAWSVANQDQGTGGNTAYQAVGPGSQNVKTGVTATPAKRESNDRAVWVGRTQNINYVPFP